MSSRHLRNDGSFSHRLGNDPLAKLLRKLSSTPRTREYLDPPNLLRLDHMLKSRHKPISQSGSQTHQSRSKLKGGVETALTEEQIIAVLKEHEAGAKAAELARKHGISEATLYNWKAKYGGMEVSEAKRLKQLEDENAKLKKLLAEQMLDAAALRELLSKKW